MKRGSNRKQRTRDDAETTWSFPEVLQIPFRNINLQIQTPNHSRTRSRNSHEHENGTHVQNYFHGPHHPYRSSVSRHRSTFLPSRIPPPPLPTSGNSLSSRSSLSSPSTPSSSRPHTTTFLPAARFVLVSRQVKWQVEIEKLLYANRLFARTVLEVYVPRVPQLRLLLGLGTPGAGVGVEIGARGAGTGVDIGVGREAARETVLDNPREKEERSSTVVLNPSHMPLMEKPTALSTKLRCLSRRVSQPPPALSPPSSTLPVPRPRSPRSQLTVPDHPFENEDRSSPESIIVRRYQGFAGKESLVIVNERGWEALRVGGRERCCGASMP